ncbi:MAG: DUF4230 domain-containing protein [Planctomycetes bacterium]|nr:DUF4230 domain-containing protein [Planctomycetota bacterium]
MMEILIGIVIGAVVALILAWTLRNKAGSGMRVDVHHSIEGMRAVGELIVFRLITQQIVTAEQHVAGRYKEFFKWLVSTQKLAVIIEYGIDFKYNLRDSRFKIEAQEDGTVRLVMPPCDYQAHIRDIKFYDERNARVLPWLLGDMTEALGPGFKEADKNKLLDAARAEADTKARTLVEQLQTEAQSSARQTLEYMARGFGVERITVDFTRSAVGHAEPTTVEAKPPDSPR